MQYTCQDICSTAQNSFWIHRFWFLLVFLQFFCFTFSTSAKRFPFRTFSSGQQQKKSLGQDWVNREGGAQGLHHVWSKLLNTQTSVGWCSRKSPIMKWANALTGTLIQMGSQNTHLVGKACTTRGLPSRRQFYFLSGLPSYTGNCITCL